jgi:hypothetical protein
MIVIIYEIDLWRQHTSRTNKKYLNERGGVLGRKDIPIKRRWHLAV